MSAVPASRGPLQRMRGWWGNRAANAAASEALPVRAGGMEYRRTTATPASGSSHHQPLAWASTSPSTTPTEVYTSVSRWRASPSSAMEW